MSVGFFFITNQLHWAAKSIIAALYLSFYFISSAVGIKRKRCDTKGRRWFPVFSICIKTKHNVFTCAECTSLYNRHYNYCIALVILHDEKDFARLYFSKVCQLPGFRTICDEMTLKINLVLCIT